MTAAAPILTPSQNLACILIEKLEGCKLESYKDSADIPTIGFGSRFWNSNKPVKMGDKCTYAEAENMLAHHLFINVFPLLAHYTGIPPKIYAALSSLIYNLGHLPNNIKNLIELKKWEKLPEDFIQYVIADGRVNQGLINRRNEEIAFMDLPHV